MQCRPTETLGRRHHNGTGHRDGVVPMTWPEHDEGDATRAANAHQRHHDNAPCRQRHAPRALYTSGWCEGFRRGAVDALRLAARELPSETWHTLDEIASRYALAGGE